MRILAVGAHPDDLELLCAGTLIKYSKEGHTVVMAHMCNGNKGHFTIPPEELASIRAEEAKKSAEIIGAEIIQGEYPDLELGIDENSKRTAVDVIRRARPDVIITHSPDDYMVDHINTSRLIVEASFIATLPHYKSDYPAHNVIPPVFFMDTLAGVNFIPTEYVDITDEIEIKEKMLLCHQSQYIWLRDHDHIDYVDFMKSLSKFRGIQCGVKYAEGFKQYQVWGRIVPRRLLP
ncbi:MAG TPA: PIG-L family deacetylase [bacterium]|nr:PIG-L family deacetylase [Dictyoglomota bacterium]HHV80223.1 PIG-L family deacetylase [bacterium]HOK29493.1 PIG-L family deacetylase [bacterium]HPC77337.1 PIG-L family deacetylase [bacterium]HPO81903.1 PIG-L family deacetylase [bacterium]